MTGSPVALPSFEGYDDYEESLKRCCERRNVEYVPPDHPKRIARLRD